MSNNKNTVQVGGGGIGCSTALGLIFIALKLAEVGAVAKWSWWWVLSPFWVPAAVGITVFLGLAFIAGIGLWLDNRARNKRQIRRIN